MTVVHSHSAFWYPIIAGRSLHATRLRAGHSSALLRRLFPRKNSLPLPGPPGLPSGPSYPAVISSTRRHHKREITMKTPHITIAADLISLIGQPGLLATGKPRLHHAPKQPHGSHPPPGPPLPSGPRKDLRPAGHQPPRKRRRRDSISVRHLRGRTLDGGTTGILPATHPWTRPTVGRVRHANPCRLDRRTFIIRRVPAPNSVLRPGSPSRGSSVEPSQRGTCFSWRLVQSGVSLAFSRPSPIGIHRRRPTPGIPYDGDRRLRFRSTTPAHCR
jgi:hypothetical protein